MAGLLVPKNLAIIRKLDDLRADRTDVAVAALAKHRRSAASGHDRRTRIGFDGLIKHGFLLVVVYCPRPKASPSYRPCRTGTALGQRWSRFGMMLMGDARGRDDIALIVAEGCIEFSLSGEKRMGPSTTAVPAREQESTGDGVPQ